MGEGVPGAFLTVGIGCVACLSVFFFCKKWLPLFHEEIPIPVTPREDGSHHVQVSAVLRQ